MGDINSPYGQVKEVHQKHREQVLFIKEALLRIRDENALKDIEKTVEFLKQKVILHFEWEEKAVFPLALSLGELPLKQTVRELQKEHIDMIGWFDEIADIILKHGFHFVDEAVTKQFVGVAEKIVEKMLWHTQKEDRELYPVLEANQVSLKIRL
ncbi:MAG: hypothetical protein A3G33_04965 [Omnitrophica bacterium RIFCSPLOWO2_12_FULL_44_17]|uniref:Hemerythrin-like domain-containing protein n=1 Tax=Candidatus Danuiimicrobium aquiferis TaxID=1801832 RepID=A0A1G1KXK0_9BACT|nr:MAG: hypothetical protein A3B72_02390 [Omnitrophica bacterium RIFCSPHIGHO2_02_FULL_45_28]OGW89191.1 MAG: hypothetical protein A3E74_07905 [Omnitrophica bacterium RIFCSPHIGHO2_12_FULL_44_12]OGW97644.1 MAG: hypothetical protein A3G33_04965 [Omnitrophica bacterium RIFCSPLOWO2_12_FULL_44_17]OGX04640.1 MAG: hypothetical protein A3J12_09205 [Omnitrophica bacterium RIFCSPLOWO2_02_FULL_44_11]